MAPLPMLALAGVGVAAFACFTWGTLYHFRWQGDASVGAWAVSLLSWVLIIQFVWRLLARGPATTWVAALVLMACSIALWAWTVLHTKTRPPTLAFTTDEPRLLFDGGPYRWVRHPFYTAYLTCWTGAAVGTRGAIGWIFAAVIGVAYWIAARHEEAKFARSPMAESYRAYRRRTGMFLPRLGNPR